VPPKRRRNRSSSAFTKRRTDRCAAPPSPCRTDAGCRGPRFYLVGAPGASASVRGVTSIPPLRRVRLLDRMAARFDTTGGCARRRRGTYAVPGRGSNRASNDSPFHSSRAESHQFRRRLRWSFARFERRCPCSSKVRLPFELGLVQHVRSKSLGGAPLARRLHQVDHFAFLFHPFERGSAPASPATR